MINKYTALAQGEKKNHEQMPIKEQISKANPQKQRAKRPTLLGNMPPKKQKFCGFDQKALAKIKRLIGLV